jgi:hypothetical protein
MGDRKPAPGLAPAPLRDEPPDAAIGETGVMVRPAPPEDEDEEDEEDEEEATGGREPAMRSCPCCEGELVLARLGGVTRLRIGGAKSKTRGIAI